MENEIVNQLASIINQLEINNQLLGILITKDNELVKDKALILLGAGLRPKDVANILNVPIGSITKARSRAKGRTKH